MSDSLSKSVLLDYLQEASNAIDDSVRFYAIDLILEIQEGRFDLKEVECSEQKASE